MFKFFSSCKSYWDQREEEFVKSLDEEDIEYTWQVYVHDQLDSIDVVAAEFEVDELGYMFRDKQGMGIAFFSNPGVKFIIQKTEVTVQ